MSEVGPELLQVAALLHALRGDGFSLGVDDHLRIGRLLATRDVWPRELLKASLRGLLAKSPDARDRFDAAFKQVWPAAVGATKDQPADPTEATVDVGETASMGWPRAGRFAVAVAMMAVVMLGARVYRHREQRAVDSRHPAAATPTSMRGRAAQTTSTPAPMDAPATPIDLESPEVRRDLSGVLPRAPLVPRWIWPVSAAFALSLGGLVSILVERARRRLAPVGGPWNFTVGLPASWRLPTFSRRSVERLADALAAKGDGSGHVEFDLPRSIEATVRAGGMPVLQWQREYASPQVALAVHESARSVGWSRRYQELGAALRRAGVSLTRWRYRGDPTRLDSVDGPARGMALDRVTFDASVVLYVGPREHQTHRATRRGLTTALWLDPTTGAATTEGIVKALEGGTIPLGVAAPGWGRPEAGPEDAAAQRAWREWLGERGWRALQLAAFAPRPDPEFAAWMARATGGPLDEATELRLRALPWIEEGRWPAGWSRAAMVDLKREAPQIFRQGHAAYGRLLDAIRPVEGSAAAETWSGEAAARRRLERPESRGREWHAGWGDGRARSVERRLGAIGVAPPRSVVAWFLAAMTVLTAALACLEGGAITRWWLRYSRWEHERARGALGGLLDPRVLAVACDAADGRACLSLGLRAETGQGRRRDVGVAMRLYRRSCELGEARGCERLQGSPPTLTPNVGVASSPVAAGAGAGASVSPPPTEIAARPAVVATPPTVRRVAPARPQPAPTATATRNVNHVPPAVVSALDDCVRNCAQDSGCIATCRSITRSGIAETIPDGGASADVGVGLSPSRPPDEGPEGEGYSPPQTMPDELIDIEVPLDLAPDAGH